MHGYCFVYGYYLCRATDLCRPNACVGILLVMATALCMAIACVGLLLCV